MSIFDTDLISSELHVPLREQLAAELSAMIKKNRNLLLDAQRTHGITAVLNCIEMYVTQLKMRPKYEDMTVTGREPWVFDRTIYERTYSTYIKGNIFIVIRTGAAFAGKHMNYDEYGNITIILNEQLQEIKFRVTDYNS